MSFALGMDLSLLQHIEDHGVQYQDSGRVCDPLDLFKAHGVNSVRLRLFVGPSGKDGQVNDLPYTLALARRVKAAGLRWLLDLHYSDGWADPQSQAIPASWQGLSEDALSGKLTAYTRDVIARCDEAGCLPDLVQTGNEITNGMLWPVGRNASDAGWNTMAGLLDAAIRGTRMGGYEGKIMIHVDQGGNREICRWFFDALERQDLPFDVIGLSYYPFWHGTIDDLKTNLAFLSERYQKEIIVVETGHDWRGDADAGNYPPTPEGQADFLRAVIETVQATPGGRGGGVFYWAPEWIAGAQWHGPVWSEVWESRALFDPDGNALPALRVLECANRLAVVSV